MRFSTELSVLAKDGRLLSHSVSVELCTSCR